MTADARGNTDIGRFVRYLLVGIWNTCFGWAVFVFFHHLLNDHFTHAYVLVQELALVIANICSITNAYIGYKWVVFKTKGNYLREYLRFYVVYGVAALVNLALLPIVTAVLNRTLGGHVYYLLTVLGKRLVLSSDTTPDCAVALLTAFTVLASFFGHKHFSFKAAQPSGELVEEAER